jgi:hypothetical protein
MLIILIAIALMNYLGNDKNTNEVERLTGQFDSLTNVIYFYEARQVILEKNLREASKIAYDTLNFEIKARDSALRSHDQQVRWLQWHVERLNKEIYN